MPTETVTITASGSMQPIGVHISAVIDQGARHWRIECDTIPQITPHGVLFRNALIVEINVEYFADAWLLNRRVNVRISENDAFDILAVLGGFE